MFKLVRFVQTSRFMTRRWVIVLCSLKLWESEPQKELWNLMIIVLRGNNRHATMDVIRKYVLKPIFTFCRNRLSRFIKMWICLVRDYFNTLIQVYSSFLAERWNKSVWSPSLVGAQMQSLADGTHRSLFRGHCQLIDVTFLPFHFASSHLPRKHNWYVTSSQMQVALSG